MGLLPDWSQYVPGLANVNDLTEGDFGNALNPVDAGWNVAKRLKRGADSAYDKKAQGYDAIRGEIDRLKAGRMEQKNYAYNLADSKYEPTRKAIQALYGDPSEWKL